MVEAMILVFISVGPAGDRSHEQTYTDRRACQVALNEKRAADMNLGNAVAGFCKKLNATS